MSHSRLLGDQPMQLLAVVLSAKWHSDVGHREAAAEGFREVAERAAALADELTADGG